MKEWFKGIRLNTILIIIGVVFALLYLKQCGTTSNLKDEVKIAHMNQTVLQDSVRFEVDRSGTLVYEKGILIASTNELKALNRDLYDEVKELKSNPKIVYKTDIEVVHDTMLVETFVQQVDSNTYRLKWDYGKIFSPGNYQNLAGTTLFDLDGDTIYHPITEITKNEFGISLITGIKKGKDTYEIFIKSDYPGFKVTNIEGSIIDKSMISSNESSWVIGPYVGYGLNFTGGTIGYGPQIGIGVTYNLNKPIKKIFRPFRL